MTHIELALPELMLGVSLSILNLVEDVLELSHASNFFVEEGAHEVLLCDAQFVSL